MAYRPLMSFFLVIALVADAERLELPVQRRALHPDEGRSPRNIAGEAADLDLEIFAFKRLAGFTQGAAHDRHCRPGNAGAALAVDDLARQQIHFDARHAVARCKDDGSLNDVAELADVTRPVVRL